MVPRATAATCRGGKTSDPYHILVSEVMLQQTQVDRVLPKYHEWLEKYPSLQALAAAPEADVTETWRPLGYNIRPRRLHAIARESVARYGGELPSDEATLRSFKGIGEYTAGAVLSFAFGQRAAILDTNVARVLFRVFVGRGDPKAHAMKRHLWDVSRTVLPHRHVFDFNQALMDFGATLCTARKPQVPDLPDADAAAPPTRSIRTTSTPVTIVGRARRSSKDRRPLLRHAPPEGAHLEGLLGVSRRQVRARRIARGSACGAKSGGARHARSSIGAEIFAVTPRLSRSQRRAALLRRARCSNAPAPLLGQEMRWVARDGAAVAAVSAGRRRTDRAAYCAIEPSVARRRTAARSPTACAPPTSTAVPGSTKSRCT